MVSNPLTLSADFTTGLAVTLGGVGIKRPSANDYNVKNFTAEFEEAAWLTSLIVYICIFLTLTMLLTLNNKSPTSDKLDYFGQMSTGLTMTLRAILNKVNSQSCDGYQVTSI